MEEIEPIVKLFNSLQCVEPKIQDIQQLYSGYPFAQIVDFLLDDNELTHKMADLNDDNFMLNFSLFEKIFESLNSYCKAHNINVEDIQYSAMALAKDKDFKQLLTLLYYVTKALLEGHIKLQMFQILQQLNENDQITILQFMGYNMNSSMIQNTSQQIDLSKCNDHELILKIQEQENIIGQLRQIIKEKTEEFEQYSQQSIAIIDQLKTEKSIYKKQFQQLETQMQLLLDKFLCNSIEEIDFLLVSKDTEMLNMNQMVQDLEKEIQAKDDSYQQKEKEMNKQIDGLKKKLNLIQRLEITNEELREQLLMCEDIKQKHEEEISEKIRLTQLLEENRKKLDEHEQKSRKYKTQYLEEKSAKDRHQFDNQRKIQQLNKKLEQAERQIEQLESEINGLESELEKYRSEHQQIYPRQNLLVSLQQQGIKSINNSMITHHNIENEFNPIRRASLNGMIGPRRNFSLELAQLIQRAQSKDLEEDKKSTNQRQPLSARSQTRVSNDVKTLQIKETDNESDENIIRQEVDYWKNKAESLSNHIIELESQIEEFKINQTNVERKFKSLYNQQAIYQKELDDAKRCMKSYLNEIQQNQIKIVFLEREKIQLQDSLREKGNLLEKHALEVFGTLELRMKHRSSKENKSGPDKKQVQLLEKQLKVQKKNYEEKLTIKDNQLQLIMSAFYELQKGINVLKYGNLEPMIRDDSKSCYSQGFDFQY